MDESSYRILVALLLINDQNKILLVRNRHSVSNGGSYDLVSSYLNDNKTVFSTAIDAARERLGLSLNEKDLSVALCMELKRTEQTEFILFVHADRFKGSPIPDGNYYNDVMFASTELLPLNTVDYVRKALQCQKKRVNFTLFP